MRLRTDVFDMVCEARGYNTTAAKAQALGMSVAQLRKVRNRTSQPGPLFIHRAITVFDVQYDDLFYLSTVTAA